MTDRFHRAPAWEHAVRLFILLVILITATLPAAAQPRHAYAVLGDPALAPGFTAFPYVNPDAPKGGEISLAALGTFDNFNPFILRGTAEPHGIGSWIVLPGGSGSGTSVGHIWETLMTGSADEGEAGYVHLASTIEVAPDKRWTEFVINAAAKFSDGQPVTAEDVAWSFRTLLEKGRPSFRVQFADVKDVMVTGPMTVRFNFTTDQNRDLPLLVGAVPVLPKHFFDSRDFSKPLTDSPIGSGPYRLTSFELGRSVVYTRDPNWWAINRPTGRGTNNFDRVRYEYFRDATVAMEAFKAGKIDVRSENISKNWATAYEFPAVKNGLVIKREYPHHLPIGIQGYAMNTRRAVFSDPRVRQAIALAFDFEWTNKNLFYGAYARTTSYFGNTALEATGLPSPAEAELLKPFLKNLPPALMTQEYKLPVTDGSGNNREPMREAFQLLRDAGWTVKDRKLVDANGQQMNFTILVDEPTLERVALPYVQNLKKLGLEAQVRTVDKSQYQHLTDEFDFDMIMMIYPGGDVPGNELRGYWSCAAAKAKGSNNVSGICDPAVDALVEKIVTAQDRDTLRDAGRALDRVLLWNWYMVPNWHADSFHVAYWDRFADPGKPLREGLNFDSWWIDPAKSAQIEAARR